MRIMGAMDRIVDEIILAALGLPLLLAAPPSAAKVAALLVALVAVGALELLAPRRRAQAAVATALLAAAFAVPSLAAFAPLIAYAVVAFSLGPLRFLWPLGALAAWDASGILAAGALLLGALACLMAWRTRAHSQERDRLRRLRDDVQEEHLALAARARDLAERQDLEVSCAVLDERARIAREVHDNVGHLLTRSVLQVEAAGVVHGGDPAVAADLAAIGATLHEALGTVRTSVHDLHETAFDPRTSLEQILGEFPTLACSLAYEATALPRPVALAAAAIVREALSNAAVHGRADRARVSVAEFPGFYQLVVEDNGRGAAEGAGRGLGLTSMEERVGALGGTFSGTALAPPRTGFRIFATFPKTEEAS